MKESKFSLVGIATAYFLIFIFVCGCNQPRIHKPKPIIVSATKIMTDYMNDAYKADERYTDSIRPFIVTGRIENIRKKETPNYINQFEYTISLQSGIVNGKSTMVICDFDRSQASSLRNLKEGDGVRIVGYVGCPTYPGHTTLAEMQHLNQGGLRTFTTDTGKISYYVTIVGCVLVDTYTVVQNHHPIDISDVKIPVRIQISNTKKLDTLVKDYVFTELQKVSNVSIVDDYEEYLIDIVTHEIKNSANTTIDYAISFCVSERVMIELILEPSEEWKKIQMGKSYRPLNHILMVSSKAELEQTIREFVVSFDTKILQKKRQAVKSVRKSIREHRKNGR